MTKYFIAVQAEWENTLLQDIQGNVESLYVGGRPLHHLNSARQLRFDRNDPGQSSVFVVEYPDFLKMSAANLQAVFKNRHILVLDSPSVVEEFNLESLCKLGSLSRVRQMQGKRMQLVLYKLTVHCQICNFVPKSIPMSVCGAAR
jgi:hypothetical protein